MPESKAILELREKIKDWELSREDTFRLEESVNNEFSQEEKERVILAMRNIVEADDFAKAFMENALEISRAGLFVLSKLLPLLLAI